MNTLTLLKNHYVFQRENDVFPINLLHGDNIDFEIKEINLIPFIVIQEDNKYSIGYPCVEIQGNASIGSSKKYKISEGGKITLALNPLNKRCVVWEKLTNKYREILMHFKYKHDSESLLKLIKAECLRYIKKTYFINQRCDSYNYHVYSERLSQPVAHLKFSDNMEVDMYKTGYIIRNISNIKIPANLACSNSYTAKELMEYLLKNTDATISEMKPWYFYPKNNILMPLPPKKDKEDHFTEDFTLQLLFALNLLKMLDE